MDRKERRKRRRGAGELSEYGVQLQDGVSSGSFSSALIGRTSLIRQMLGIS